LHAAERHIPRQTDMVVDPNDAGFELACDFGTARHVLGPNGSAETEPCRIGTLDYIVNIPKSDDGKHRAEWFFIHQSRSFPDIGHDRRGEKIPFAIERVTAGGNAHTGNFLSVFKNTENAVVLFLVLDRAVLHTLFEPIADMRLLSDRRKLLHHRFVD